MIEILIEGILNMVKSVLLAKELVKEAEGFSSTQYADTRGIPTIGYGRNLNTFPLSQSDLRECFINGLNEVSVSKNTAEEWAMREIKRIYERVKNESYFKGIGDARQAVIIDMIYNMGEGSFKGFVKFKKALEDKDFETASKEAVNSRWFNQVGERGKRNAQIIAMGEI